MELSELYNARIIELAAAIGSAQRLANPDGQATTHSQLCGSTVSVDLQVADGKVVAYGQTVKACLLGQASASVMSHNIVGTSAQELRAIAQRMRAMLKQGGPPPDGRWSDLAVLEPVKDFKAKKTCTLLGFDAVEQALDQAEAKQAHAVGA